MKLSEWNDRFSGEHYVFGRAPSSFMIKWQSYFRPGGKALAVADGEGRNGVFMAEQGMNVDSMDSSANAQRKAAALARRRGVALELECADITHWHWRPATYDVVAALFIQFVTGSLRDQVFAGMKRTVKPGGVVMVHGYTPKQLDYRTGGPGKVESLYTDVMLRTAFDDFDIVELESYETVLEEGEGHAGRSALIDLVARRPG